MDQKHESTPTTDAEPFAPHLWAMWRMRHRKEWEPLSGEDRAAYNRELRRKLASTLGEERQKLIANLELDWAALTPSARLKYEARIGGKAAKAATKAADKAAHGDAGPATSEPSEDA